MRTLLLSSLLLCFCFASWADEPEKPPAPPKTLPLHPERTIEFETDEGTWISLDVSPDGKTIVFELLGDLYTLPIGGGDAKPLLTGMAMETQPRFSPDGKEIAFLSDRDGAENLWVIGADGAKPRKLSEDRHAEWASPCWTPDGQFVVVSKSAHLGANELWLYHRDGGGPGIQMTKSKTKPDTPRDEWNNDMGATFSPDGKFVYFARRKRNFSYNVTFPLWQLVRRNLVSGDEDTITNLAGSAIRPLVSPDGKWLVYGTRYEQQTALRIRDLATGEDRWLASSVQRDDQESRATRDLLPGYAFTPDSAAIVLNYQGHIWRIPAAGTQKDARMIPFKAHVKQDLGPLLHFPIRVDDSPTVLSRLMMEPTWSPDGKQVAFSSFGHLYAAGPDGKNVHRLTSSDEGEYQPSWSPDGQTLVYVTWSAAGGSIKTVAAAGGTTQTLTRLPAFYRDPVFSPDGKSIFALHLPRNERFEMESEFGKPQGGLDLISLNAAGGDWKVILPSRGTGRPHFINSQPDRVFLYGPQGLHSVRLDGSDSTVLLKVVGPNPEEAPEPPPATDVRLNPKGDLALVLLNRELWLIPVPRVGGTPTVDISKPGVALRKLTLVGADSFAWASDGSDLHWSLGASTFSTRTADVALRTGDTAKSTNDLKIDEVAFRVEEPRSKPTGVIALRGATLITMRGDEVIPNADIVVTANRISAIGKHGQVTIPPEAKTIDVRGATIMPGIIDVHAHWIEIRRRVLDTGAWPLLANLAYGVTSGRDPQTSTNDMFAYQDWIDAGVLPGPRAYSTGPGIFSYTDFQSADEAEHYTNWYATYYRTNTVKSYTVGNRQQRQWMIQASKKLKLMPTTEGALDLKLDLTHVIDGFSGSEHALPIVPLYKDVVELFARSGVTYTPTLLVAYGGPWAENTFFEEKDWYNDPKLRRFFPPNELWLRTSRRPWFQSREQIYPRLAEQAGKILAAGGNVGLGGHGQFQGLQCHWEMWAMAAGGISPHNVLKIATINGAKAIGFDQDLGSLEVGKLADLLVLDKNPLDDIRNTNTIHYVMKNGELFDAATLNRVLPTPKPLPALWWWNDRPDAATASN